jgi:1,4-alpha-glucan branching enzyme
MDTPEIVKNDPYLQPFKADFNRWSEKLKVKEAEILNGKSLKEFASGHLYFGLFKEYSGWVIREWAPNATNIYLTGSFNDWNERPDFMFTNIGNGCWELRLDAHRIAHGDLYALSVYWNGGLGKRIPAWTRRAVQDNETKIFNAQVWSPEVNYNWQNNEFIRDMEAPIIYEAHIGMSGEEPRVHTFNEFRTDILPKIKAGGYNTVQLMAIPEHPYYGSFGYHVSSFFAASSRFGTPEELKQLIDEAHGMGISVIMDIVHSHAVKNVVEGLGSYDGTRYQFFHEGPRGEHPAWDSYCFNYNKNEVLHFLLSNIRFWLEEYKFDGFRFDGVTSMLYFDHGLGKAFTSYADYFTPNIDDEAIVYFKLANRLIHEFNPHALSIAEDMSGLPGLAAPLAGGGLGFDYRMSMGVPDYWIKLIKEQKDEEWNVGQIFHELTSHRADEKVVSYAESHDQAMVGDKTIVFRLLDKEMYFSMRKDQPNLAVDRGIALHKMIRLATLSCAGGAYLNFMGNEFGHPEWIDFPREGNGWSYQHARRIWSIAENPELRFHWLLDFDRDMINLVKQERLLEEPYVQWITDNTADQVLAFRRKELLFIFNFNPYKSFEGYGIQIHPSKYKIILQTDAHAYGGFNRIDDRMTYYSIPESGLGSTHYLKIYLPARTAIVLKSQPYRSIR